MEKIVGVINARGPPENRSSRNDDDFVDRLSHRFTTTILIVSAIVVSTKQYVGDAINCWVPAHFTGNQETYTNSYCWVRNTYYLPVDKYIPRDHEEDKRQMIPYYQWVPLILLVQALCSFLPCIAWRTLNKRSGMDVNNIVETAEVFQDTQRADEGDWTLRHMTQQMHRYLNMSRDKRASVTFSLKHVISRTCCRLCGRRQGNYLVSLYILIKVLFIANAIGQLVFLNTFLGNDFHVYGFEVLRHLSLGDNMGTSSRFPRVTMCDFKVRRLGNVQRYTVQCVLPINLFNEKIYLFLWFWFIFVAIMTCISLLTWGIHFVLSSNRHSYVKKHLQLESRLNQKDSNTEKDIVRFVDNYLKQDGVFVLRLVGHNTNAITATQFTASLWDKYQAEASSKRENSTVV